MEISLPSQRLLNGINSSRRFNRVGPAYNGIQVLATFWQERRVLVRAQGHFCHDKRVAVAAATRTNLPLFPDSFPWALLLKSNRPIMHKGRVLTRLGMVFCGKDLKVRCSSRSRARRRTWFAKQRGRAARMAFLLRWTRYFSSKHFGIFFITLRMKIWESEI